MIARRILLILLVTLWSLFGHLLMQKVFELREQTLNSEVKNELIRLLRTDLPEFGTSLTQLINIFCS